ncbi:beta-hexosaminidase [Marinilabiliaceae bacterium JC017]|nr:beta-hexosaminidase [Marinilabiliaceae bacterium JC017]
MRKDWFFLVGCFWVFLLIGLSCDRSMSIYKSNVSIIPYPNEVESGEGCFTFTDSVVWNVESEEQEKVCKLFIDELFSVPGIAHQIVYEKEKKAGQVTFLKENTMKPEAYELVVSKENIIIKASSYSGYFYALQSLRQLLPFASGGEDGLIRKELTLPVMTIRDCPRFKWRGYMLDVSRHFIPKADVMKLIDQLAIYKINKFHWHLVDDNGWRIEIKKYPLLTQIGSRRVTRGQDFPNRPMSKKGEQPEPGGFYTQNDIREVVAYAKKRCVTIIPEIEMPAHTASSIVAYPWLGCPVVSENIAVPPGFAGGMQEVVYCAGNERVFEFLEDVLTEVMDLFPSEYIHIGGDEASRKYWKQCPLCQQRIKEMALGSEDALQGYFMDRMSEFLSAHGKKAIGWDEILSGDVNKNTTVMGWRGNGQYGYEAGYKGNTFVMCPARSLYFIRYQGPQWFEPLTYFGNVTLKDVYTYEPLPDTLNAEVAGRLQGVQGCLWTEFVTSAKEMEYMTYPRLMALAEVGWTLPANKNWDRFIERLENKFVWLKELDIRYSCALYNIFHSILPEDGKLKVTLSSDHPRIKIKYQVNGSLFKEYTQPILVDSHADIRAYSGLNDTICGKELELNIHWNNATGKRLVAEGVKAGVLVNGQRGSLKFTDGEWCGWYDSDAEITIDLGEVSDISTISIGSMQNPGMRVVMPREIEYSFSDDSVSYRKGGVLLNSTNPLLPAVTKYLFSKENLNERARYVKFTMKNPGVCPKNHIREGDKTWMYFDEIMIDN